MPTFQETDTIYWEDDFPFPLVGHGRVPRRVFLRVCVQGLRTIIFNTNGLSRKRNYHV